MRQQCERLAASATRAAATAQLEGWLAQWRDDGFGLADELATDRALASATALAALAARRESAEELWLLLNDVRARLDELARPEPDLALALGHGWLALTAVPLAAEIPAEELSGGLEHALAAAESIDAADRRDAFGARLANELHRVLRAAGRGHEAAEMLERALARFPDDPESRPYLLAALADERRARGELEPAFASLAEADAACEALRARAPGADLAVLERTLAGVRCQLELATGLVDRAALSLDRERRAVEAGARDPESILDLLLNASGVALASGRPFALRQALGELQGELATKGALASRPAYAAQVRARAALAQEMLEDAEPTPEPRARALLRAAFDDAALDETHRTAVGLRLFALALRERDLDSAEACLARLEQGRQAERAPELSAALVAARARVALASPAGEDELRAHLAALGAEYETFLRTFRALPERDGGLGYLAWRNRTLLLGTLVDLCLALDGDAGRERAIDLLLREQALGSLARRLECGPGTLAEVRAELLPAGVGLLLYAPGWTSTHVFCVDAAGIVHREVPWKHQLEPLPRDLATWLASSPARLSEAARADELAKIRAAARELAARLLPEPIARRVATWRGAYVVGSERLGGIPFECLPLGDAPLGERVALAHLPSLPVGLELARRARARAKPAEDALELLLVAAPRTADGLAARFPSLVPFELDAVERASLSARPERTLVLAGADAQWSRVQAELRARTPRVLHFFVHGVPDPERELSGGLALAPSSSDPDGLLWCEELLAAELEGPPLVLFSACGAARGPRRVGDDGMAQLGGAFLSRGTLCTVLAASDVALEPTRALMEHFTRELRAGAAPAEAMRRARVELARTGELAHPFYASSMRVVGLGFEPVLGETGGR